MSHVYAHGLDEIDAGLVVALVRREGTGGYSRVATFRHAVAYVNFDMLSAEDKARADWEKLTPAEVKERLQAYLDLTVEEGEEGETA